MTGVVNVLRDGLLNAEFSRLADRGQVNLVGVCIVRCPPNWIDRLGEIEKATRVVRIAADLAGSVIQHPPDRDRFAKSSPVSTEGLTRIVIPDPIFRGVFDTLDRRPFDRGVRHMNEVPDSSLGIVAAAARGASCRDVGILVPMEAVSIL